MERREKIINFVGLRNLFFLSARALNKQGVDIQAGAKIG
jgi:hypothetical protein